LAQPNIQNFPLIPPMGIKLWNSSRNPRSFIFLLPLHWWRGRLKQATSSSPRISLLPSPQSARFLLSFRITMSTHSPLFPIQFLVLMAPSTRSIAIGSSFYVGDDGRQELQRHTWQQHARIKVDMLLG
jgi:hypothetical protein